jgi:hypothetical protein
MEYLNLNPLYIKIATMKPLGKWNLYAAQTVCVGFYSSQGDGAAS